MLRSPAVTDILARPWNGEPLKQGHAVRLHKTIGGRERDAIGELWTHELGWEIRLFVAGEWQRSQVCRTQDEVFNTADEWRDALKAKGWA